MRMLLGALVGAIVVFIGSAILHMATPLGTAGMSVLQNEAPVLDAFRANVPASGLYLFPGFDPRVKHTDAEEKEWEQKLSRGPYGLLVITNGGSRMMSPRELGLEFVTVLISALIAAFIIARSNASYATRALIVALLALFAFFSVSASHWIWYKFPPAFILGEALTEVITWFLGGLAMARIIRPPLPAIAA